MKTPEGTAVVMDTNVLKEQVKVRLVLPPDKNSPEEEKLSPDVLTFKKSEVKNLEKKKKRPRNDDDIPEEIRELEGD